MQIPKLLEPKDKVCLASCPWSRPETWAALQLTASSCCRLAMLRMISTIFSTLEKLRQQQVVQSCVTAKRQLQFLAPAASSHKMPAIYIEQWRSGRLLFERIWVAGFWRVVWTSQQWKQYYNAGISETFWETCGSMFRRRETKSEDPSRSAKKQSIAEPNTAVALCTAISYFLSRGIVRLDTNDTKIKDGKIDATLFNFWEHRPRWCTRKLTPQKKVLWAKEIHTWFCVDAG